MPDLPDRQFMAPYEPSVSNLHTDTACYVRGEEYEPCECGSP